MEWDVKIGDEIEYFDPDLSYEITGYRPIDKEHGLDFSVDQFIEARETKRHTGKYSSYVRYSKQYNDFWHEERRRCRNGMTNTGGYTITGDHYYFLNYYQLPIVDSSKKASSGRNIDFPRFIVEQYKYFHYLELCKRLKKNSVGLKARGVGFSEIAASILVNSYTCRNNYRGMVIAAAQNYLDDTLDKAWDNMNYLDTDTEEGMRKLRQVHNTKEWRKASAMTKEGKEIGSMSEIVGKLCDVPKKVRGDRCDILLYEESGSWPDFITAWIQGTALTEVNGDTIGIKMAWGTGGDEGKGLEGLAEVFLNPNEGYECLPYRHNYTVDGEYVLTGFFVPAFNVVTVAMDDRGFTDPDIGREFYEKKREAFRDAKKKIKYCAEYCFTPDDALALQGENQFNKDLLAQQKMDITIHKSNPSHENRKVIYKGNLEYFKQEAFNQGKFDGQVIFHESPNGMVQIFEHPIKEEGVIPKGLYVAGIDGIDSGMNETSESYDDPSKFCIVIKKRVRGTQDPAYVAMYKDRPQRIEEAYKICLKLLQYYNCKACIESTKLGFLTWMKQNKLAEKYLIHRPESTYPASSQNHRNKKNQQYGTPAPPNVIAHYLDLISEFVEDYCYTIFFEDILNELLTYNYSNKRKFDIIAAMGMAELYDEEMFGVSPKVIQEIKASEFRYGYWRDSRGIMHKGRIPSNDNPKPIGSYEEIVGNINENKKKVGLDLGFSEFNKNWRPH